MPSAGDIIRAADVGHTIHEARCTSPVNLTTTSATDITGATVTFTTSKDDVEVTAVMLIDITNGGTGWSVASAWLDVDGVDEAALAVADESAVRGTVGQAYSFTLATAGSHTIKMQGRVEVASGTAIVTATHTGFVATVYDVTT